MYECTDCKKRFEYVKIAIETHGLSGPPYERVHLCPFCDSTNFFELPNTEYCRCCGARLSRNKRDYCNDTCRRAYEKIVAERERRILERKNSELYKAIKEVDEYNAAHNTTYSYGQYFALKGEGKLA